MKNFICVLNRIFGYFVIVPAAGLILLFLFATQVTAQESNLMAGASTSNITPNMGEPIVGGWNSPPASYIHDELHARSLVLDDGEDRLVFVVVDNVSIKREIFDAAKHTINIRTGIPMSHILMSATHTHSATSAGGTRKGRRGWQYGEPLDEYQRFLSYRIADGVQTAIENLEPARIAWGSVDVPEHVFNRRWFMKNPEMGPMGVMDKVRMNPPRQSPDLVKPAGPIDPEVSYIAVESRDGRPISLLANYSLHYVGGVPRGHVSADYFAIFADRIQELLGADRQHPPFVGIMSNGTSGDINNINFQAPSEGKEPYEKMTYVANDVAEKVYSDYKNLSFKSTIDLAAAKTEIRLEVRKPDDALKSRMEKVRNNPEGAEPIYHRHEKSYARRIDLIDKEWPDSIDIILQTFRIGDLGIATSPFETFAETGLEIKEKSPMDKTFTIELANGAYGYLPTPSQHKLGGYETWLGTSRVEYNATVKIVDALMTLFDQVAEE